MVLGLVSLETSSISSEMITMGSLDGSVDDEASWKKGLLVGGAEDCPVGVTLLIALLSRVSLLLHPGMLLFPSLPETLASGNLTSSSRFHVVINFFGLLFFLSEYSCWSG